MRRRQVLLAREEVRRMLNTEQAAEKSPEPPKAEEAPKRRGRPRKVKNDDTP
jgi:hypothetical protein